MYLPTDHTSTSDFPDNSTFREKDWHILAGFWHPVAFSTEVQDKPHAAKLLDLDLVVYRTQAGVVVARDRCPHRGSKLTLGWMDEKKNNIVCPFHGNHYDSQGKCTRIPSYENQSAKIPKKMCLGTYQAVERYGLIWTCLKDEALNPIPAWTPLESHGPEWRRIDIPKGRWQTSAARHAENFSDMGHLSWVHMKTFGNREQPQVPDYFMEKTESGLRMEIPYASVERGFNSEKLGEKVVDYDMELTYPFATVLKVDYSETVSNHFYDAGSPITAQETDIYQVTLTNNPSVSEDYVEFQLVTNDEDIVIVESQSPKEVPLNLAEEVHVPADKFGIQYRRDMIEKFGLGSP